MYGVKDNIKLPRSETVTFVCTHFTRLHNVGNNCMCFRRQRATPEGRNVYVVVMRSLHVEPTLLSMQLLNLDTKERLKLDVYGLRGNMVRLKMNEVRPLSARYEPPIGDVLVKEPEQDK